MFGARGGRLRSPFSIDFHCRCSSTYREAKSEGQMPYLNELEALALIDKLRMLAEGERVVYHTGCLATDRRRNKFLAEVANEALKLHQKKRVLLTQAHLGEVTEYIAIGRSMKKNARANSK
jgi:hypothetical protein